MIDAAIADGHDPGDITITFRKPSLFAVCWAFLSLLVEKALYLLVLLAVLGMIAYLTI